MNKIYVYADWVGLEQPEEVGVLHVVSSRGKQIFSFEYDEHWLHHAQSCALDPSLQLFSGKQYPPDGKNHFGLFLDSSPDCWGRLLMNRREALCARKEGRKERKLLESDYLLGVYDEHRMGALRFRTDPMGFDDNKLFASPPWTSLRELEHASLELEKDHAEKKVSYSKWLQMLIAPGGSLGGARPKAGVVDQKNHLWIAKFPSAHDEYDVGAWEMLALKLAKQTGINVSEGKIKKFNRSHHTFLTKRFDRTDSGNRIHFASAMTLLQYSDGDDWSKGVSYLELAEFILQQGANPLRDLEELWRRIVFNICISNVDDHLRNHGFLLDPQLGWLLSPAYDLNPVRNAHGLTLNISENDNSKSLELAKEVADYFRLSPSRANQLIDEVVRVVKRWRREASLLGIPVKEQEKMASAFEVVI